jgi:glycosyltransferase involved in cell wall biosynthesis
MKIVQVHNFYQLPGGEDAVVEDERALLEAHGHRLTQFTRHNDQIGRVGKARLAAGTVWNRDAAGQLETLVRKEKPAVVHFHNTMPLISPSAYYAARRGGAAVVQTLHNYRLLCPKGTLFRDGRVCESCVDKAVAWPAVRHACYRQSRSASAALMVMRSTHRVLNTYHKAVDAYIATTRFARDMHLRGGLPSDRVYLKPNFVAVDPGVGHGAGGYALYVGRLSPEKGIGALLEAWRGQTGLMPLVIVGDGPQRSAVETLASAHPGVTYRGWLSGEALNSAMQSAGVLVLPSLNYEGFPKVIVEAFAAGLPVIASRLGAMAEVIEHQTTGLLFSPGQPEGLRASVSWAQTHPDQLGRMRGEARARYEKHYRPEPNYQALMTIYDHALKGFHG